MRQARSRSARPRSALELVDGGVEAVALDDLVQPPDLASEGDPAGDHRRDLAGADPPPPEALHLAQELLRRDLAGEQVGEALRVDVEAGLDRHPRVVGVVGEQLRDHMGAGAAGAADEEEVGVLRALGGEVDHRDLRC